MAETPSSKLLPLTLGFLALGAGLGYAYASGIQPALMAALLLGLAFAALGCLVGTASQLNRRMSAALESREDETRKLTTSFQEALSGVMGAAGQQLTGVQESLAGTMKALDSGLKENAQKLDTSLAELSKQLRFQSTEWGDELAKIFNEHSAMQQSGVNALSKVTLDWKESVERVLNSHADRMDQLSQALSGQYEKTGKDLGVHMEQAAKDLGEKIARVNDLALNVDQVLKVSRVTEEALQSLANAGALKETLETFRTHLQESDRLLKEATKPKQFQLVESFGEDLGPAAQS